MNIGTDIIKIQRIKKSIDKFGDKFKKKFLNPSEIALSSKMETLAGFWAAKEAVSKALRCGIGKELSFHDITIEKDTKGAPSFKLSKRAQNKHEISSSSLSISHDGDFAIAVVAVDTKD